MSILMYVCVFIFSFGSCGGAVQIKSGPSVAFPKDSIVGEDILAAGNTVNVGADIMGDVTIAGNNIYVTGNIRDSVMAAGNSMIISGEIGNDAWIAGNTIDFSSPVKDNAYIAGATITFGKKARTGGDLLITASDATVGGEVGKKLRAAVNDLKITGVVNGDVIAKANELTIMGSAVVKGNLFYESANEAVIAPGAKVMGKIERRIPPKEKAAPMFWCGICWVIGSLIAAVLYAIIFVALFPNAIQNAASTVRDSFWASMGVGFLALVLVPIAFVILLITMVGAPTSLVLLALHFVFLYSAKVVIGLWLGQKILGRGREGIPNRYWSVILGLVILAILTYIPFFGWIIWFAVLITGYGGLILSCWKSRNRNDAAATST